MAISCPNCGGLICSPQDRPRHAIIMQSVRIRRGETVRWHWSAIASCNARIVATAESYPDVLVALDAVSDALHSDTLPSRARTAHHTPALR